MKHKEKVDSLRNFLTKELWDTDLNPLTKRKRFSFISLRVIAIILKGFKKDKCSIYAAALTNITVMSLVPTLAFMFAIAQGFKFYDKIKGKIEEQIDSLGQVGEVLYTLIEKLQETDLSALGVIGLGIMFWTVISLMGKIESTFNHIWGIQTDRDFVTKCKEYFFILMIVPTILLLTTSINTALKSPQVSGYFANTFGEDLFLLYEVGILIIAPLTTALAFTYLYKFLPNTKVKFIPAFVAGIVTTLLWQALQWAYVKFQIGVSDFNSVYGTFASVPLFMGWLYSSWLIILFGAELAFAVQNHHTFEDESRSEEYSVKTQLSLALYLTRDLSASFIKGEKWTSPIVLKRLKIPTRFGNKVLDILCKGGVMKRVNEKEGEYLPAKDLHSMTLKDVLKSIIGEEDKLVDHIQRKEFQELIGKNNRRLDQYTEEMAKTNLFELISQSEGQEDEVSNKEV